MTRPLRLPVPEIDRDHVFVKFRARQSDAATNDRVRRAGAAVQRFTTRTGWTVVKTRGNATDVASRLRHDPTVAQVSLSYIRHATSVPNDPRWASAQVDYLGPLRMDRAWDVTKGSGVTVAVIDTGANFSHPDLTGQFVNNTGINELSPGAKAQDDNGHGTMTAGIIAAKMNNSRGIAGIAPQAKLLPVKVLDASGSGSDEDIAQGIEDVVSFATNPSTPASSRPKVINMSLGGPGGGDVLCPAVSDAIAAGIVVVASTGNDFAETIGYPASCPGVIAVSATTHDGALAAFSSYGARTDVAAPGYDITSTSLGSPATADTYATESGTSFSAPIVSGVAALIRSHLGYNAAQTREQILDTARDVGPPGVDRAFGHGIVDPLAAVDGGQPLAPAPAMASGSEEPDGTPATATPLTVGVTRSAQIFPETDEDWFSISLAQNQWYRVRVTQVGGSAFDHDLNPVIRMYDAGAHFLASQEFAGGDLVFKAPATGTFLVRVANAEGSTKPYTILVSTLSQPDAFQTPVDVNLLSTAQSVAIGDLTGDGRNDVAFLMGDSSSFFDTIVVLNQTSQRSFALGAIAEFPFAQFGAVSGNGLAVGDVTGDGKPDALFPTSKGVEIVPQISSGLDTNWSHWSLLSFSGTRQVAVADVNGDGHNDVIAAGTGGVTVFWSGSANNFTAVDTSYSWTSLAVGDISGDGRPDLVGVSGSSVRAAVWTSGHNFNVPVSLSVSNASNVAIDAASRKIAVTVRNSSTTGAVRVLHYNSSALSSDASINLAESNPQSVAIADVDGGGSDIIMLHDSTGDIGAVPIAGGTEKTYAGDRQPSSQYDARALAVGDIDDDMQPDAVVATSFGVSIVMHRLDSLPPNYGSYVVTGSDPQPLTDAFASGTDITLTLADASTDAGSTVQLLDAHGDATPIATPANGTSITIHPSSPLADGAYSVRIDGMHDNTGDVVDDYSLPFVVGSPDETAPSLTFASTPSGYVSTPPSAIAFASSDTPAPTYQCRVDNGTYHVCTSPTPVSTSYGAHSLDVLATDVAGNETIKSTSWNYRAPPHGYWMVGAGGTVYPFGTVPGLGSVKVFGAADIEASPSGYGYWIVDVLGHVYAFGDAKNYGGAGTLQPNELVTSISRTRDGNGYWLFTSRGRVIARGNAQNYGDMHKVRLNGPVLDSVATPSGHGYYMVASDGGVFAFGDARFYGSMGAARLPAPVRTLTPDPDGAGYWLAGTNGSVYAFRAAFHGSMGGVRLNKPVVGMVSFGNGYLMVASDGGIFNFSNKPFYGSLGANPPSIPIASVAAHS